MPGQYDRKDHFYERAKNEGYRSRAAYKLLELNNKYKLINLRDRAVDLGAWPGGWLQVAAKLVGPEGLAVGVDLVEIDPLPLKQAQVICGDLMDPAVLMGVLKLLRDKSGDIKACFDVVLSDMSPKLSGIREVDQAACINCAELARRAAATLLKPGGNFVAKVFKSNESEVFAKDYRKCFGKFARVELEASRNTSNEFYIVGLEYKGEK